MKISIPDILAPQKSESCFLIDVPNRCPHCYVINAPKVLCAVSTIEVDKVGLTIQCSNCGDLYYATYSVIPDSTGLMDPSDLDADNLKFKASYPAISDTSLPAEMNDLYPDFYEIYAQAEAAERASLTQLVGMGYRKALETIVKAYDLKKFPEASAAIKKEKLYASIQRIDYKILKDLANASRIIGNDEVHTQKIASDYDAADMKRFIISFCHLILAEHVANEAHQVLHKK